MKVAFSMVVRTRILSLYRGFRGGKDYEIRPESRMLEGTVPFLNGEVLGCKLPLYRVGQQKTQKVVKKNSKNFQADTRR